MTILKYITIYGSDGKININTASETIIASISPRIDEQILFEILKLRNDYEITKLEDLLTIPFFTKKYTIRIESSFLSLELLGY